MTKDDKEFIAAVLRSVAEDYDAMEKNPQHEYSDGFCEFAKSRAERLRRLADELEATK